KARRPRTRRAGRRAGEPRLRGPRVDPWRAARRSHRSLRGRGDLFHAFDRSAAVRGRRQPDRRLRRDPAPAAADDAGRRPRHHAATTSLGQSVDPSNLPDVNNSIGMALVLAPSGRFRMGDPLIAYARPHVVQISRPFLIGVTEVTQAEYRQVVGENPSEYVED